MNPEPRIPIGPEAIKAFCQKWRIVESVLFGSVLTDEFRPDSDVDVMVEFAPAAQWTLRNLLLAARDCMDAVTGRQRGEFVSDRMLQRVIRS